MGKPIFAVISPDGSISLKSPCFHCYEPIDGYPCPKCGLTPDYQKEMEKKGFTFEHMTKERMPYFRCLDCGEPVDVTGLRAKKVGFIFTHHEIIGYYCRNCGHIHDWGEFS